MRNAACSSVDRVWLSFLLRQAMPGTAMDLYGMALPMPCGRPGVFLQYLSPSSPIREILRQVRSERLLVNDDCLVFFSSLLTCLLSSPPHDVQLIQDGIIALFSQLLIL